MGSCLSDMVEQQYKGSQASQNYEKDIPKKRYNVEGFYDISIDKPTQTRNNYYKTFSKT